LHILSVAEQDSQSIRATADRELARIVGAKAAEVEAKEADLKAQLERLWLKFRHGLEKIQQERPHASSSSSPWSSPTRTNDHRSNGLRAPVAIPGFIPVSVGAPTQTTPPPPRKSWLSQSIAETSHLHQEMASRSSHAANGSEGASTHSESLTIVPKSLNEREITSVRHFKRTIDDTINTAASYRYFMNLGEEMSRHKKEQGAEADSDHDEAMGIPGPARSTANIRNSLPSATTGSGANDDEDEKGKKKEENGRKESKNKSKHVHFNVQPAPKEPGSKKSQGSNKLEAGGIYFHY
jgi:hypothetical protein